MRTVASAFTVVTPHVGVWIETNKQTEQNRNNILELPTLYLLVEK